MLHWQPEPPRRRRIRGEKTDLLQRHNVQSTPRQSAPSGVESSSTEEALPTLRLSAVAVSPCSDFRLPGMLPSPTNLQPPDSRHGAVHSRRASASCHNQTAGVEQQLPYSILLDEALSEIKKSQDELRKRFDRFTAGTTLRLERLERPAAASEGSSTSTLRTIKEFAEEGGLGQVDETISREVSRQVALRTEVSSALQGTLGNDIARLQGTLKAEAAEHAAVSEAGLIEAKATMAASVERLRETLQHEVGILHANLQGVESRVERLEGQPELTLRNSLNYSHISQSLLQQSPRCAVEKGVGSVRHVSRTTPVTSRRVVLAQPQGAGSPRPVTPSTNRIRPPQERQALDGLQQRLAGKVSGIVSVLNRSCEARSYQHGSQKGNSSADSRHAAVVWPGMSH